MVQMDFSSPYEYPYCKFDFFEWNPVQMKCVPFFTEDCNLIVSSTTASGKTAVAEAIMGYELDSNGSSKAVYVSPLKAIGVEKYGKWMAHPTFGKLKMSLLSSDSSVSLHELEESRLVVSTVESLNLKCRARDKWIAGIGVLVFDEAHLIGDKSRGAGSEAMIMALTRMNPNCRIILLSGTMSNYIEMARWIKNCNGKSTRFVNSNWRPVELKKKIIVYDNNDEAENLIYELVARLEPGKEKALVFVHSKNVGEILLKYLKRKNIHCAFYNAGVQARIKSRILFDFQSRYCDLNVLICTSSLGMGVDI